VIVVSGLFHVGNRIEIDGMYGDVIDISIFYTTLLEIRGWVHGDQATGRLVMIPNGVVLSSSVCNYTKDHHFLWDEVVVPITHDSDWRLAVSLFQEVAVRVTSDFTADARKSLSQLEQRYYFSERTMEPSVFVEVTDNWVSLTIRYVVEAHQRRVFRSRIMEQVLIVFEKHSEIRIASSTLSISDIPEVTVRRS
ncbi:MAG: mechanosensitive ion channel, partial [Candidatus Moranbacteria bacterium]|nr:mechanosensitive ion channel [Candidatus Moranbacteria bacterium]